ncbi:hypothetical protein A2U94_19180 [Bacillus sp. VT 712]|uniref:hypothetical protein n=1 Tax=Bacillaceae TaxID=186817 RepID=UPI00047365CF|nr:MULTISPECIES: hypothetical protein [Bacillaceae]KZB89875.1 hypothetical protein A2U94_19180 [Bacillus sp. VT 712]
MKTENKKDFIKEFGAINKNKFTLEQTKSLYLGLLYELISNKKVFKRNIELEDFISNVFKKKYNPYLFKARPYLASRLLKDVAEGYDFLKMSASIKLIIFYLQDKGLEANPGENGVKKSSSSLEDDTINWFKSVKKGSNKD